MPQDNFTIVLSTFACCLFDSITITFNLFIVYMCIFWVDAHGIGWTNGKTQSDATQFSVLFKCVTKRTAQLTGVYSNIFLVCLYCAIHCLKDSKKKKDSSFQ